MKLQNIVIFDNGLYLTDLAVNPSEYTPFNDKNTPKKEEEEEDGDVKKKSSPLAVFKSYL